MTHSDRGLVGGQSSNPKPNKAFFLSQMFRPDRDQSTYHRSVSISMIHELHIFSRPRTLDVASRRYFS